MRDLLILLTFAGVLGSGLVAGVFFAFSSFVMRALGRLPESDGIAAMKAINVTVLNPGFFLAFFGTGAICLPVAFLALGSSAGTHRVHFRREAGSGSGPERAKSRRPGRLEPRSPYPVNSPRTEISTVTHDLFP